jgi:imidazolonepropionase-like amidohydrolase
MLAAVSTLVASALTGTATTAHTNASTTGSRRTMFASATSPGSADDPGMTHCKRAATALGLGHRKGRLRSGYDADVLAVDGNPLSDPAALNAIRAVYVRGTALTRTSRVARSS